MIVVISGVMVVVTGSTLDTVFVSLSVLVVTVTVGDSGETANSSRKPSGRHLATWAD